MVFEAEIDNIHNGFIVEREGEKVFFGTLEQFASVAIVGFIADMDEQSRTVEAKGKSFVFTLSFTQKQD